MQRQLEREAAHFYAPKLRATGIYFDLEMGWSTSHGDGDLIDLVPLFAPDPALRERVLVTNSARLYGFE